jgi:FtsH-binding integral membrane protein
MTKRKVLGTLGLLLFIWGLMVLNFITDILPAEYTNKPLGTILTLAGLGCMIASNFFKEKNR